MSLIDRILLVISVILGGGIVSCSHGGYSQKNKSEESKVAFNKEYSDKLWKRVSAEIQAETESRRLPASTGEDDLNQKFQISFKDLASKDKSFELYVFPKVTSTNFKTQENLNDVYLSSPQLISVKVPFAGKCSYLIKTYNKGQAAIYFNDQVKGDTQLNCAIFELTNEKVKNADRRDLKEGDEVSRRIFIDERYRVYGLETDFYSSNSSRLSIVTHKKILDGNSGIDSGLGFIPSDILSQRRIRNIQDVETASVFADGKSSNGAFSFKFNESPYKVDRMAMNQIRRLNGKFSAPRCQLKKIEYQDELGRDSRAFWCQKAVWPSVIETANYVAVAGKMKSSDNK